MPRPKIEALLAHGIDCCARELAEAEPVFLVDADSMPDTFDAVTEVYWLATQRLIRETCPDASPPLTRERFRELVLADVRSFADLFERKP